MSQPNAREVVLLGITTVTTNGVGPAINLPQGFSGAIVTLNIATVSGTSPTMNVYVQNLLPQAGATDTSGLLPTGSSIPDDLISFTTATTTSTNFVARLLAGSNTTVNAQSNKALTAATIRPGPIGGTWQVAWTAGGTTPSVAMSVVAELLPLQ